MRTPRLNDEPPRTEGTAGAPARILHVIPGEESGQSMIFSKRDVEEVRKAGMQTAAFFLETRTRPFLLFKEWRRLKRAVKSFVPDIVHAHYGTVTAVVACLAVGKIPLVVTFHNAELQPEPDVPFLRQKAGHFLSQIAALRADGIICVSEPLAALVWWRRDRVRVIPSSVDPELFRPQPRSEARQLLGWNPDDAVVLFYKGRNPGTKRLDRALATVSRARELYGPVTLEILGYDVEPDRIPIYLNAADCLLCTSDAEGSPTIVKEAMACNLPVVSVDVGDVRQRLTPVEHCFIRDRNPEDLADSLVSVLRSGVRSNGRMHLGDVTNHATRANLLRLYRSVAKKQR